MMYTLGLMCGRFVSTTPAAAIARLVNAANPAPNVAPSWNIAPSQQAETVATSPKFRAALFWTVENHRWDEDKDRG